MQSRHTRYNKELFFNASLKIPGLIIKVRGVALVWFWSDQIAMNRFKVTSVKGY